MPRRSMVLLAWTILFLSISVPAWACAGLVSPNGGIKVLRTTTLAAYHDGVEHYVTQFQFQGDTESFGSIVPLPDVPTDVQRGGDWTLERLVLETQPVAVFEDSGVQALSAAGVEVLETKRIKGLDITVLRGGGFAVGRWAEENGFGLSPDAPEILDFYAERSPVFMAAKFDVEAAKRRGVTEGDGVSIHLTIPTDDPWVPLRILGLGQAADATIEADVYLLTDREPALLPGPAGSETQSRGGLVLERSEPASTGLLADMRSDRKMGWLPSDGMWLTYLRVDEQAGLLDYDLAIDASGAGRPSPVDAGLSLPISDPGGSPGAWPILAAVLILSIAALERARVKTRWA